jgi:predicted TIM-barrel fold metal-dependent hydrolase
MIIDCHAHVFQNWQGLCGHDGQEVHWKYIQKNVSRPSAKVRRARDGAHADAKGLFLPGDNTWAGLRSDVQFRVGTYGRVEFTLEGEDYYIQYMPVAMAQIEAPPESMLAQMAYVGVDHCVLQAGMSYGVMNGYNAFAQHQYPEKFTALFHVDEPKADLPRWMGEVDRAVKTLGLRGLYYQLDGFARYGFQTTFDDRRYDQLWEALAALRLPIFFECSNIPNYNEASYLRNMQRLDTLLTRYPALRFVLVMGPPVQFFAKGGRWEFPEEVAKAYGRENLQIELMFPITWGGTWDYPYPEAQALTRDLRDRYGAGKLVWGSDMPNVERFCTYRQSLDYVRKHCTFLSPAEQDRILGGNIAELFSIRSPR